MPRLFFVMLNPSTADGTVDDPTIRRCVGFATRNGYGSIQVFNLFAFRATHPEDLKAAGYPVGPDNDTDMVADIGRFMDQQPWPGAHKIVCAWGAGARDPVVRDRAIEVTNLLTRCGWPLHALAWTADGIPRHPLMLAYGCGINPVSTCACDANVPTPRQAAPSLASGPIHHRGHG
jgi:hypothetical protein